MTKMHTLQISTEQANMLLDTVEFRIDDLNDYLINARAAAAYRGDEIDLDGLKVSLNRLKDIATLLDHQINEEN